MAEDSEKLKKLSEYLDMNLEGDISEIKATFDKSYIKLDSEKPQNTVLQIESNHPDLYKSIVGKYSGTTKHQLKKLANDLGVELTWSELEDAKSTDVVEKIRELAMEKVTGYQTQLSDYEIKIKEAQKNGASAKDIEAAQKQVDEWKQKYEDTAGLLESAKTEFDSFKTQQEEGQRKSAINQIKSKVQESVKLKTSSPYEKKGFIQHIDNKYQLDFEGGEEILRGEDGKRIPHPEKHGAFMNYEEAYTFEAAKEKMLDDSPHTGKPAYTPPVPTPGGNNGAPKKHEIVHPSMRGK